jgi:tetratricopeptide (TPR) repeat protein
MTEHEIWNNKSAKVKGVFTDIQLICQALKQAAKDCDCNAVSISLVNSTDEISKDNLNTLHCSFMYTQILKEILLTIDFEQEHIDEFSIYCREELVGNITQLKNVDRIQKEYYNYQPIWWYTYESLMYSMLNRSLRLMDVNIIVKMGFFLRDLHRNIATLHTNQIAGMNLNDSLIVYRGQGLSQSNFEQLKNTQGGLLAFNNFLSTSFDRQTSYAFAESNKYNSDLVGVLFKITIDPSISSSPFASIEDVSHFQQEKEILFSMHSVFRIGQMTQLDESERLWQVELTLTSDNDPRLKELTEAMQKETKGTIGWKRLSLLLINMGEFNKAEELYEILLKQTSDQNEKGHLFHQIGVIKDRQGKYAEAIEYCEKSIQIEETIADPNDPDLATSYNNIGGVYYNMGEYVKALEYYNKALEIRRKTLSENDPDIAQSYNNIGLMYDKMGDYKTAVEYHEKTLEIYKKTLPSNHPLLATSYNNIGMVYDSMGDYKRALEYYEKAFEIFKIFLPPNHPNLATSYNNIATMYGKIGEYSKALNYHETALEMFKKTLPANHSHLATSYTNIANVYNNSGEYSQAIEYNEKALEIYRKTFPEDHPHLAVSYNSLGVVYYNTEDFPKALEYYNKALEIQRKTLSANNPNIATSYNNIAMVYKKMGKYSESLEYDEKALEIWKETLPSNHPHLAISSNNIGLAYKNMGDYKKALTYYEWALDTLQQSLPANHPNLEIVKENIEIVKEKL